MPTKLYWVDGPWRGKRAPASRPRGGEWLGDEIENWRLGGIDAVFSLLTAEEERDLNIVEERKEAIAHGLRFLSLCDRQVPRSENELTKERTYQKSGELGHGIEQR